MIAHNQEMVLKHQIITRQKIFQNDLITQVRAIVLIYFDLVVVYIIFVLLNNNVFLI